MQRNDMRNGGDEDTRTEGTIVVIAVLSVWSFAVGCVIGALIF